MKSSQIQSIVVRYAEQIGHEFNIFDLKDKFKQERSYALNEVDRFIHDIQETSLKIQMTCLEKQIKPDEFRDLLSQAEFPVLFFTQSQSGDLEALMAYKKDNMLEGYCFASQDYLDEDQISQRLPYLITYQNHPEKERNGDIIVLTFFPMKYLEEESFKDSDSFKKLTPLRRFFKLLREERKDIFYVYVYAIIVGFISLSLPLGIQAIVGLISGGMIFSSVVVLISLVVIGVVIAGGLQIMQLTLVEILQQRVFAKAAFEYIFRIVRIKPDELQKYHPPELMNRFFDILTVQKGLPKLLVEITGALIQIIFGLTLLALYHPSFLVFAFFVAAVLVVILYYTSPKGLDASLKESKFKYKIAHWLQEVARNVNSFRLAGTTGLPLEKMDKYVNSYLYYRKAHFRILLTQFASIVAFKTIITGGLLVIGTLLVVDKQISLGQFVASEVIIILVVTSVEKLIISMDTIYDLLTAVEKIANVTDLPLEKQTGISREWTDEKAGLSLQVKDLKFRYNKSSDYVLKGIDLDIHSGERLCLVGGGGAGKHTLIKILLGLQLDYNGSVSINQSSIRDLSPISLREAINNNFTTDEIFAGSILENITMGRVGISYKDVMWALEKTGLKDFVDALPEGLNTELIAEGRELSISHAHRLILARCIVSKPRLLVINDHFQEIEISEKVKLLNFLHDKSNPWTLLTVSTDLLFISKAERIVFMEEGLISHQGSYNDMLQVESFRNLLNEGSGLSEAFKNIPPPKNEG